MIALFDKYLRKWLLGLAVTVRNRAQAVIAKMASGAAAQGSGADRIAAPDAAQPARAGAPPAHWVRLVKRHAPELLQPGPPDAFPQESGSVPESPAGTGDLAAVDIRVPPPADSPLKAGDAQTHAAPTPALNLPRPLKDHDNPGRLRLKPDGKKQSSGSGGPPEAAVMPAKSRRVDAPQAAPRTTQAGFAAARRFQSSPAAARQSPAGQFLRTQRNEMPVDLWPPNAGTREAEARAARAPAAHRLPQAAGPIATPRAAGMERKNIQADAAEKLRPVKQSGGRDEQFERQADGRQGDFSTAASMPAQRSALPEAVHQSRPRPREQVHELKSAPDCEPAASGVQAKRTGDDFAQTPKIGRVNERAKARPPQDDLKIEAIRSRSPEFRWPGLPGEKKDPAAEAFDLNPVWPDLPEEQPAAAAAFGEEMQPYSAPDQPRSIERLQRLDEEQKGISWSASRF